MRDGGRERKVVGREKSGGEGKGWKRGTKGGGEGGEEMEEGRERNGEEERLLREEKGGR